jgi:hypothetical protein
MVLAKISTTSCGGGRDGDISSGRGLTGPPLVDFLALKFHEDPISFPKKTENKNPSVETINKES